MRSEEISKRRTSMIVLNVKLNNLYAFKNFNANFTYPKKIVGSTIKDEFLPERPNFRYKKINVFLGANASGKTTFGVILRKIFNFIDKKNYELITDAICDKSKEATFVIDLASKNNIFYRVICNIEPCIDTKYSFENIKLEIRKENISLKDSYESCVKRIDNREFNPAENYITELEQIEELAWLFVHPRSNQIVFDLPNKDQKFCFLLEKVLKSLDPSIQSVDVSSEVDNAYVIRFQEKSIVLQNDQRIDDTSFLSSGTRSGIVISQTLYSLMQGRNSFYYCDEKFSFIHSDIEKAILSLMIDFVGPCDQLFFTTHNTDVLDMDLPKHTFSFLRKNVNNFECPITYVEASSLLKRSTDSLRNAVENDLFLSAPSTELIYSIANLKRKE